MLDYTPRPDFGENSPLGARNLREERRQLACVAFAITSIFAVTVIVQLVAALFIRRFCPEIVDRGWFDYAFSLVPMYCIAMPFSLLFFLPCKAEKPERRPMRFPVFLGAMSICFGISYVGSLLGNIVNSALESILGSMPVNDLEDLTSSSPLWLTALCVGLLAPVLEELFFRKLVIDRLLRYGELPAILISGISFGLIHGNFYQLFYAAMVGIVFGVIYVRSGSILPTMVIHVLFNMMGGVYTTEMLRHIDLDALSETGDIAAVEPLGLVMFGAFMLFMFLMFALAIVSLCLLIPKLRFKRAALPMKGSEWARAALLNPGVWAYLLMVVFSFWMALSA